MVEYISITIEINTLLFRVGKSSLFHHDFNCFTLKTYFLWTKITFENITSHISHFHVFCINISSHLKVFTL